MVRTQDSFALDQRLLVQRDRLVHPACRRQCGREVVPRQEGGGVNGAEDALAVGQRPPVQRDRLVHPAEELIAVGEIVP